MPTIARSCVGTEYRWKYRNGRKKIFSLPFGTSSGREGLVIGGMMTGCVISAIFVTGEHDAKGPLSRGT